MNRRVFVSIVGAAITSIALPFKFVRPPKKRKTISVDTETTGSSLHDKLIYRFHNKEGVLIDEWVFTCKDPSCSGMVTVRQIPEELAMYLRKAMADAAA